MNFGILVLVVHSFSESGWVIFVLDTDERVIVNKDKFYLRLSPYYDYGLALKEKSS